MPVSDLFSRVQWGEDFEAETGKWHFTPFPEPYIGAASVSGMAFARPGTLPSRTIGRITVPRILAVKVPRPAEVLAQKIGSREIARIAIGDPRGTVANAFANEARNRLGDWGIFNWMKDIIASVAYGVGYITGAWLQWLWNLLVQPQVDRIRDSINAAISDQTDRINSALSTFQTRINTSFSDQTDKINTAIGSNNDALNVALLGLTDSLTTRVNAVLEDFYRATGIPSGVLITPLHTRNVTPNGFEWQSYGNTKITWMAVGRSRSALDLREGLRR